MSSIRRDWAGGSASDRTSAHRRHVMPVSSVAPRALSLRRQTDRVPGRRIAAWDPMGRQEGMAMRMRIRRQEPTVQLREVGLFASCTEKELLQISALCSVAEAPCGEVLTRQGAYGDQFFVIVEGEATVWRDGLKIATLGSGDFFGEMALLEGNGRSGTVVAETDVQLLVMTRTEFRSLGLVAPTVTKRIMVVLSSRLRQADALIAADRK